MELLSQQLVLSIVFFFILTCYTIFLDELLHFQKIETVSQKINHCLVY